MPSYDCGSSNDYYDDYKEEKERADKLEKELNNLKKMLRVTNNFRFPNEVENILSNISDSVYHAFRAKVIPIILQGSYTEVDRAYLEGFLDSLVYAGILSNEANDIIREFLASFVSLRSKEINEAFRWD